MQWKAFILSLSILLYGIEYLATPKIMAESCMAATAPANPQQSTHSCCQKEKPDQCPKPGKTGNTTNDCCLNCPLCYVTVLTATAEKIARQTPQMEYSRWVSSYLYRYHASCWKPPNAA